MAGLIALLIFVLVKLIAGKDETKNVVQTFRQNTSEQEIPKEEERSLKPLITEDFLTVNEYSRPGEALEAVNNIFVHYTANRRPRLALILSSVLREKLYSVFLLMRLDMR